MNTLQITIELHQITDSHLAGESWWADITRKRLLEIVALDGFTEKDFCNPERYSDMRQCARDNKYHAVRFYWKDSAMPINTFVFEKVNVSIESCRSIQMVERYF